ncbi:MAG: nitrous oxide reductase family maturation protein NosD [bacterium]|nr:nitrous oxide reductase family maturation protein NosD [bacterium]
MKYLNNNIVISIETISKLLVRKSVILLIHISIYLVPLATTASVYHVCETCQIKSLGEAVVTANRHDTIKVRSGRYECTNLEITKPLSLIGETGAILDGKNLGYVLKLLGDHITVRGFKIINAGKSYTKDYAAIYAFKASQFKILDNEMVNPFFGILIEKSDNGLVQGNFLSGESSKEDDSGNGIHLWHCKNVDIVDNEIHGLRDGIYLEFVDSSKVRDNYAHHNIRYGLHFMFSNQDTYLNNTFESNGAGVAVMFSKFITMKKNRFLQNWGTSSYGLLLKEIYDADVTENEFKENTIGIFIEGSTRVNYFHNDFSQNGWAVKVSGGCYTNKFFKNNFLSNAFDVSYNSRMNDNSFHGNYWSEYTGYDLDDDEIGDIPYRPVKLFSYIVNKTPETIILLRSLFVDIINFSERVSPVFTPDDLVDEQPSLKPFQW